MITPEDYIATIRAQHQLLRNAAHCLDEADYAMLRRIETEYSFREKMSKDSLREVISQLHIAHSNIEKLYQQEINYEV